MNSSSAGGGVPFGVFGSKVTVPRFRTAPLPGPAAPNVPVLLNVLSSRKTEIGLTAPPSAGKIVSVIVNDPAPAVAPSEAMLASRFRLMIGPAGPLLVIRN